LCFTGVVRSDVILDVDSKLLSGYDTKHILTDSTDQEVICQNFTLVLPEHALIFAMFGGKPLKTVTLRLVRL